MRAPRQQMPYHKSIEISLLINIKINQHDMSKFEYAQKNFHVSINTLLSNVQENENLIYRFMLKNAHNQFILLFS